MSRDLQVKPFLHPFTKKVLLSKDLFIDCFSERQGSLNLVFPQVIADNFQKFKQVFEKFGVSNAIHFAHKPNKSFALVKQLSDAGSCIDVASFNELQNALNAGFDAKKICAGGPKNQAYIDLCVDNKISMSVDSLSELLRIAESVSKVENYKQTVLVRLNVESVLQMDKESRFGICVQEIDKLLEILKSHCELFDFQGFSFHINANAQKLRAKMFEKVLDFTLMFMKEGFNPTQINVGGGFKINYVENSNQWHAYTSTLISSVIDQSEFLGWNKSGLGYWNEKGALRGQPQFGDLYQDQSQYDELSDFLSITLDKYQRTVAEILQDFMLTLIIEPGRAMLDSCGMTVSRIIDKKTSSIGNNVLILDMNRSQLGVQDQAYMIDPILLENKTDKNVCETFIAGNLCMKSDLIYRHKTFLPYEPEIGEYLAFVNSAGYYMDFAESFTLQQPIAQKYAVFEKDGELKIIEDNKY